MLYRRLIAHATDHSICGGRGKKSKTYNTEDSQVVTDPSTNSALCCLYMGERTGSLVFSRIWSYVKAMSPCAVYIGRSPALIIFLFPFHRTAPEDMCCSLR